MMTAERDRKRMRKRGEREGGREPAGPRCSPTWANRMCDGAHIRELGQRRKRERRDARAYACVCRALCTCTARWSAMADQPQLAKSALPYVQCENERGYRLRATESAMRFINPLRRGGFERFLRNEGFCEFFNLCNFNFKLIKTSLSLSLLI